MNANKRDYLIAAVVLILVAAILIYVNIPAKKQENLIAKIRYFDGSMDTIRITGYSPVGGSMWLKAEDGNFTIVGANNVIIVEDEDY